MKILIFAILAIPAILCCETKIPDEDQIADAWDAIERLIEKDERLGAKFLRLGILLTLVIMAHLSLQFFQQHSMIVSVQNAMVALTLT